MLSRRQLLHWAAMPLLPGPLLPGKSSPVSLSIGNYGMPLLAVDRALAIIREIGYDGAELCLMAGWPSEPAKLDAAARRLIRRQGLPIPSMIENLNLLVSDADHASTLNRIRRLAAQHGLQPGRPFGRYVMGQSGGDANSVER